VTSQLIGSDFSAATNRPAFVNGRLLTAEDLTASQIAMREDDCRVGRAAGTGVVDGLWVGRSGASVTIAPGLGVAPSGETVAVANPVSVPLTLPAAAAGGGGSFTCCASPVSGSSAVSAGCYLLTALPVHQPSGRSPLAAPSVGCTAQWEAEGVAFKAIPLPLPATVMGVEVTDDNRRNLLAQWAFGSPQLATLGVDPFAGPTRWSGFDQLAPTDLTPSDLPLAVFFWNGQSVPFADNWSARRRMTCPDEVGPPWSAVLGDHRQAEAEARLLQFEDHVASLLDDGLAPTTEAATTFPFLPPVGYLPLAPRSVGQELAALNDRLSAPQHDLVGRLRRRARGQDGLDEARTRAVDGDGDGDGDGKDRLGLFAGRGDQVALGMANTLEADLALLGAKLDSDPMRNGFDLQVFFATVAQWGGLLDWETADLALRTSWQQRPVASAPVADQQPLLTYFLVKENVDAGSLSGEGTIQPYVVFVKNRTWYALGRLPFSIGSHR
jgi:hypothetical protein